jgi:hypothetical protein
LQKQIPVRARDPALWLVAPGEQLTFSGDAPMKGICGAILLATVMIGCSQSPTAPKSTTAPSLRMQCNNTNNSNNPPATASNCGTNTNTTNNDNNPPATASNNNNNTNNDNNPPVTAKH